MGALPSGTVGIVSCLGDLYLEVGHFFQKNPGLGKGGWNFQAFGLEKHLDGGHEISFGHIYSSTLRINIFSSRYRDGIEKQPLLAEQVGNCPPNSGIIDQEEIWFDGGIFERRSSRHIFTPPFIRDYRLNRIIGCDRPGKGRTGNPAQGKAKTTINPEQDKPLYSKIQTYIFIVRVSHLSSTWSHFYQGFFQSLPIP